MNEKDLKIIWHEVLESVKVSVSSAIFSTWFTQTELSKLTKLDNRYAAEIACASSFIKSTIETRYFGLIQDALTNSLGSPCDLLFSVKQLKKSYDQDVSDAPLFKTKKNSSEDFINALTVSKIRFGFKFENFAVSSSNQMAWAAAEAVCKNPGESYNPLFIWGGVGVGKTHLTNAIGYEILVKDDGKKVLFCTGEQFTNDIVEGIRKKTTQSFRDKYRKLDTLLIDDIQFIAGKDTIQEEFFHTFNALVGSGKQVVLNSDRPPSEISKLEDRLRSRFEAGLIVDISNPDFELRCAIVQIKLKEKNMTIPMDIIQLIAGNLDEARKIEGLLVKIASEVNIKKSEITKELVQSLLGKTENGEVQVLRANPNDLISCVGKYYSLGKRALLGSSRARMIARPRQVLMYLLRTQLGLSLQEVGRLIGGRDHTTVMHAVDKITNLVSSDVQIREDIRGIKNML